MAYETTTWDYPWDHPLLRDWSIIGMNHYHDPEGRRCLFVAMTDGHHRCIQSEGSDEGAVWRRLLVQAEHMDKYSDD